MSSVTQAPDALHFDFRVHTYHLHDLHNTLISVVIGSDYNFPKEVLGEINL
jgi:hypothetical protein